MLLFLLPAFAGEIITYSDDFATDTGAWSAAGVVTDGVLVVSDGDAALGVTGAEQPDFFTLSARVRLTTMGTVTFGASGAEVTATIHPGDGSVTFGVDTLPLPMTHLAWAPEPDPVFEATGDAWEAGGINHPEVFRDDDGTWFLYYTAWWGPPGYGYRQIGLATSPDAITWTRYAGNPVLTIDYDLESVDGVHVHMPTVTKAPDSTWHMYYSCYQNNFGNRICHATSPDGYAWSPIGMAIDKGAPGEFDEGSLRMPDVWIGRDGTWHLWYDGTDPEQHYGPTGYATIPDGYVWTKQGEILDFDHALQGLSVVESPYGLDVLYNKDDYFAHAAAQPEEPTTWAEEGSVLAKGWAWWNDGYIQAPTLWLDDTTYRMWFNGYTYTDGFERIGAAHTEPVPGTWLDVSLRWESGAMTLTVGGAERSFEVQNPGAIHFAATGTAELDDVALTWVNLESDTGDTGDTADSGDSADSGDTASDSGASDCGCNGGGSPAAAGVGLALLAIARQGARSSRREAAARTVSG